MRWTGLAAAGVAALAAGSCALLGDFASDDPGFAIERAAFDGAFLAASDADMAGSAYGDGVIEPLPAVRDTLTLFRDGAPVAEALASNSVISWPQIVDVSADGRFAAVVETRGELSRDVEAVDDVFVDLPEGSALSVFAVSGDTLRLVDRQDGFADNPQSVEFVGDTRSLVIGSERDGAEAVFVHLDDDGRIAAIAPLDLDPPFRADDAEQRVRSLHVAPNGALMAANVANRRVQFYRITVDANGLAAGAQPWGPPSPDIGRRLAVGKWSVNSRFFIVADTNWADSTWHMLTQGPGALSVVRAPMTADAAPVVVASAEVGRSPEGFGISPDGRRVATINMERTYLPNTPPLSRWPGRRRYSISLLGFDPDTGALDTLDRVFAAGILPEDVIFDSSGDNLAVAVFHRRLGDDRRRGFVDFFSISADMKLQAQGITQPVARGPHDLVRIP